MSHPEMKNKVNSIITLPTLSDLVHVNSMAGFVEAWYKDLLFLLSSDNEKDSSDFCVRQVWGERLGVDREPKLKSCLFPLPPWPEGSHLAPWEFYHLYK